MTRRLIDWDYRSPAIYQITIVAADRAASPFGSLKIGARDDQSDATIELSPLGIAVADCWESIPRYYPEIKIIGKQVMPDHFHGILWVKEPLSVHLGQVIKGFKTGCNKAARALGVLNSTTLSPSTARESQSPSTVRESLAPSMRRLTAGGVFAEGFQDSILFGEGQLKKMINYLADNPRRLALKRLAPDLFTVANRVALPLVWSESRVCRGWFTTIGNRFLLERPLYQVQVSRRFFRYQRQAKTGGGLKIARDAAGVPLVDFATKEFDERRAEAFAAAEHGAVLLSPCVSDGEREIARLAHEAKLALVTMANKGFAKLQKPVGKLFDACLEGRLLMLAPAAWPYQTNEKPMTRDDATAMNRLCQAIAREGAAEINYHGMTPTDVDAMAWEAAEMEEVK